MKVKKLLKKISGDYVVGIYDQKGNWEKQFATVFKNDKYYCELKVKSIWGGMFQDKDCVNITVCEDLGKGRKRDEKGRDDN